jgi:hypothetical protein
MRRFALILLLLVTSFSFCFARDTTVTVKAVNMEMGAYSNIGGAHTYTWHSMIVEVDGVTYTIGNIYHVHEQWLHKGTYSGRWKNRQHSKIEIDSPDGRKVRRIEFKILGEN